MKNKINAIIVIVLICAIIGLGIYWGNYIVESSYNEAITLIQNNKWTNTFSNVFSNSRNLIDYIEE